MKTLTNDRGFTLMETVMAMAIISFGAIAVLSVIPLAAYGIQEGNQLTTATRLAEERIEQARNAGWHGEVGSLIGATATEPGSTIQRDCLGVSAGSLVPPFIPASCTNPQQPPWNVDEIPVAGFPQFERRVRIFDCSVTPAVCGGRNSRTMRLVRAEVRYMPLQGTQPKTVRVEWLATKRCQVMLNPDGSLRTNVNGVPLDSCTPGAP